MTTFERFKNWVRHSVSLRIASIAFLVLILLIPSSMVKDLINERQRTREYALNEISGTWGYAQTVTGPVLTIPYRVYFKNEDEKVIFTTEHAHFLPKDLTIEGVIEPEIRYRGIYEIVVYRSNLEVKGKLPTPDFTEFNIEPDNIMWKDAFLSIGIPDMRGIKEQVILKWNDGSFKFNPGIDVDDVLSSGISTRVPVSGEQPNGYDFAFQLQLNGSDFLHFSPLGQETTVKLSSSWSTPSFDGAFLPEDREIIPDGFHANWRVLHLNRNFPQSWLGGRHQISGADFGVKLLVPVDQYQKSYRSARYAIMFISLTFMVFFFIEILNSTRIHPVQYILVGLALVLFYTLLLSISEHLTFDWAYIIGSGATTLLITGYALAILKNLRLTGLLGGMLIVMYGFIYSILQLEDYALLMGSIGLFIVLAVIMYLSRKIDWYAISSSS